MVLERLDRTWNKGFVEGCQLDKLALFQPLTRRGEIKSSGLLPHLQECSRGWVLADCVPDGQLIDDEDAICPTISGGEEKHVSRLLPTRVKEVVAFLTTG